MKGFYWNSRGLSDLVKYRYISDAIRDHKLDFVAVMETGKQDMPGSNLNRLSGDGDLSGIVSHLGDGRAVFYWELTHRSLICPLLWKGNFLLSSISETEMMTSNGF